MPTYALNLFDLADNDDYLAYSRDARAALAARGARVVAMGGSGAEVQPGATPPRQVMVLVEWPDHAALDAYLTDPANAELHPKRDGGTENYLWWTFDRLEDLRSLLKERE